MASLKEIKGRIASVSNTLKITSAMKMVSSAKLHRSQSAAAALAAYDARLKRLSEAVSGAEPNPTTAPWYRAEEQPKGVAVVAIASDSSLCGSFNNNAIKALQATLSELKEMDCGAITLYPIGEKMVQAVAKGAFSKGCQVVVEYRALIDKLEFGPTAALADHLIEGFMEHTFDRVVVVHNHFFSMGRQAPITELFLPLTHPAEGQPMEGYTTDYLLEPKREELIAELIPYMLRTRLHTTLLDSSVAEHAARMIAMQTATDNATTLLEELRLSYNKGRQQAITAELSDITQAAEGGR